MLGVALLQKARVSSIFKRSGVHPAGEAQITGQFVKSVRELTQCIFIYMDMHLHRNRCRSVYLIDTFLSLSVRYICTSRHRYVYISVYMLAHIMSIHWVGTSTVVTHRPIDAHKHKCILLRACC